MTTQRRLDSREVRRFSVGRGAVRTGRVLRRVIAAVVGTFTAPAFDLLLHEVVEERDHPRILQRVLIAVVVRHVLKGREMKLNGRVLMKFSSYQRNVFLMREHLANRLVLDLLGQAAGPLVQLKRRPKLWKEIR